MATHDYFMYLNLLFLSNSDVSSEKMGLQDE